jgi:hypothetical protein
MNAYRPAKVTAVLQPESFGLMFDGAKHYPASAPPPAVSIWNWGTFGDNNYTQPLLSHRGSAWLFTRADRGYGMFINGRSNVLLGDLHAETGPTIDLDHLVELDFFEGVGLDVHWIPPSTATFTGVWQHGHPSRELLPSGGIRKDYQTYPLARSVTPGASLSLKFEGSAVSAFVLAGADAGIVEVRIDGGAPREVDLYHVPYSGHLNYPRTRVLADGLPAGPHTLELRISPRHNPASKGTACNILYFGINR